MNPDDEAGRRMAALQKCGHYNRPGCADDQAAMRLLGRAPAVVAMIDWLAERGVHVNWCGFMGKLYAIDRQGRALSTYRNRRRWAELDREGCTNAQNAIIYFDTLAEALIAAVLATEGE